MNKKGLFITLEGVDGCGKTLMAELLMHWLRERQYAVVLTKEPGGSPLGRGLRQMLLQSSKDSLMKETETLLFAADRAQHCREIIRPALEAGKIVVCDRFRDSTLAYQGGGRGIDAGFLEGLNAFAAQDLQADCTFYLQVSLEETLRRREEIADRMEQENHQFYRRVMAVYEDLAQKEPGRIRIIDAARSPQKVFAQIEAAMEGLLPAFAPALKKLNQS